MRTLIGIGCLVFVASLPHRTEPVLASGPTGTEVYDWNAVGCDVTSAAGQNAIITSRALSMMHIAIHDALNAIDRRYEPYVSEPMAAREALPDAAIHAAAHAVLAAVLPSFPEMDSKERAKALEVLNKAYETAIAKVANGAPKESGIAAGKQAARAILELRKDDRSDKPVEYKPGSGPGQWRPHPNPQPANPPIADPAKAPGNAPAVLPHWAHVTPFAMAAPWQFRMAPPPALDTEAYAKDFEEVKKIGGKSSEARTPEQTEIAKAWYDGSPHHFSRIAKVVGTDRKLDLWDSARLLALVNMAVADGYIAGADTRYHYNYWRPVTAIREADKDGNDATAPDPTWESLLNTPALPDYPSTHSVCAGAAAAVLARFFGTDAIAFTVTSGPPFAGITRSFKSFTDCAKEICDSRVYNGVHFRTACTEGMKTGLLIGRRTFAVGLHADPLRAAPPRHE